MDNVLINVNRRSIKENGNSLTLCRFYLTMIQHCQRLQVGSNFFLLPLSFLIMILHYQQASGWLTQSGFGRTKMFGVCDRLTCRFHAWTLFLRKHFDYWFYIFYYLSLTVFSVRVLTCSSECLIATGGKPSSCTWLQSPLEGMDVIVIGFIESPKGTWRCKSL